MDRNQTLALPSDRGQDLGFHLSAIFREGHDSLEKFPGKIPWHGRQMK